jgi:CHAT domain-containing protein
MKCLQILRSAAGWGGWPNVFLRAGTGAFVGAAWAVRDKPAAAFSTAFYNALLDGETLADQ